MWFFSWFINFSQTNWLFNRVKNCLKFLYMKWICRLENFSISSADKRCSSNIVGITNGIVVGNCRYKPLTLTTGTCQMNRQFNWKVENFFRHHTFTQNRLPFITVTIPRRFHKSAGCVKVRWKFDENLMKIWWKLDSSSPEKTYTLLKSPHFDHPRRLRFPSWTVR